MIRIVKGRGGPVEGCVVERIREGAMHQHDRRLAVGLPGLLVCRIHWRPAAVRECGLTSCPPGMMPERMG
jgi:hypothetical protein